MIGYKIQFNNPKYNKNFMTAVNGKYPIEFLAGTVLDKIVEPYSTVSPGWARSSTGNSNDVSIMNTKIYYIVAEDITGNIYRINPSKIIKVIK